MFILFHLIFTITWIFFSFENSSWIFLFFYFFPLEFLTLGPDNFCLIHVSLVPVLNVVGEQVNLWGTICLHSLKDISN